MRFDAAIAARRAQQRAEAEALNRLWSQLVAVDLRHTSRIYLHPSDCARLRHLDQRQVDVTLDFLGVPVLAGEAVQEGRVHAEPRAEVAPR